MLELILEVVGEFLLQVVSEALLEFGLHSLAEPLRNPLNPWLAALGYMLSGAIFGGLSLLVFPANLVPQPWRIVNLVVAPLAAGGIMVFMGTWRAKRGQPLLRIDRFLYGYLFALSMSLIRFQFAD